MSQASLKFYPNLSVKNGRKAVQLLRYQVSFRVVFNLSVVNPKQLLCPISAGVRRATNQSEFRSNTYRGRIYPGCQRLFARLPSATPLGFPTPHAREQIPLVPRVDTNGFGLVSHWLKKSRPASFVNQSWSEVKQTNADYLQK